MYLYNEFLESLLYIFESIAFLDCKIALEMCFWFEQKKN